MAGEEGDSKLGRRVFGNKRGTVVIYDSVQRSRTSSPEFVAYWYKKETDELFLYNQRLTEEKDLREALSQLEAKFGAGLGGLPGFQKSGSWELATVERLHALMGLAGAPPASGTIGIAYAECPPWGCEERGGGFLPSGATHWSVPPPPFGASFEDLLIGAVLAINCCGGGGPPGPGCGGCCCCCALERTTKLAESNGQIIAAAACCAGAPCNDGNACTLASAAAFRETATMGIPAPATPATRSTDAKTPTEPTGQAAPTKPGVILARRMSASQVSARIRASARRGRRAAVKGT
jgi:hypothetical protein